MDRPLVWSTLNQAAEWLSNQSESKWDREKIINFSIENYKDENSAIRKRHFSNCYDPNNNKRIYKKFSVFSKANLAITYLPPSPTYLSAKFPKPVPVSMYDT